MLHIHLTHEWLSLRHIFGVPLIVPPNGVAHEITGRGKSVFFQEGQRLSERIGITIIERKHDEIAFCIATKPRQPLPDRHAPQPETANGPQLTIELLLIDVQQLELTAGGTPPDIVVAENGNLRHEH